jgi:DNA sulfur modification protein DndC
MTVTFGDTSAVTLPQRKAQPHNRNQGTFLDGQRLTLEDSLELTAQSLAAYALDYHHWAIAYSGGKDSTATVAAVTHLIATGRVPVPETLTVLYADTRQELPPLHLGAMAMLEALRARGIRTEIVLPTLDDRYWVYVLGRGVPPPNNNTLRWCTPQLKVEPMTAALKALRDQHDEKFLMLTGVRVGESAARDQRIALSCGRNGGECGQGWFQETTPESVADTLAPLLHWRVCHVWDWLMIHRAEHGLPTQLVAEVYGGEEAEELNARTGCIGCNLAEKDLALDYILSLPQWAYLAPLKKVRPLNRELRLFKHRKQKAGERNKGGELSSNPNRKGPLTLVARAWALDQVLAIQAEVNAAADAAGRPRIDLINAEEEARIRELIAARTYPQRWSDDDPDATVLVPQTLGEGIEQPLLLTLEERS